MKLPLLLFLILAMASCQQKSDKEILAEVDGMVLYKEDVLSSLPHLDNKNDTVAFINQRAESWMRSTILLNQAKQSSQSEEIDALVDNYRNELIISEFERNLISQKLDTSVTDAQIQEYIEAENIEMEEGGPMIKVKFGKVKSDKAGLEKLDKWWEEKKWEQIKGYCATFAEICLLEEDWITLTEFKQYFPDKAFSKDVLKKKGYTQKSYGSFEYFLSIIDRKEKSDELSSNKKGKIKRLILHSRAKTILKNYKEELYQSSLDNQKIKFYLN